MSIHLLVPHQSYEANRVHQELLELGQRDLRILMWNSISHPIREVPDVLWVRFSPRIPIIYQLSTVEEFENQGTRVVNSKVAIETCDKMSSYLFWKHHFQSEILMPPTLITQNIDLAKEFVREHDCIFKPISLGLGQGVQRIFNDSQIDMTLQALLDEYGLLFLQEFIANPGYDIRAIVIDGENIIEYARANVNDFRYNVNLGGEIWDINKIKIDSIILTRLREIAVLIARKAKLDMVGVDFLIAADLFTLYLLEWNAFFNFQGVETTLGENIAGKIAIFLNELAPI